MGQSSQDGTDETVKAEVYMVCGHPEKYETRFSQQVILRIPGSGYVFFRDKYLDDSDKEKVETFRLHQGRGKPCFARVCGRFNYVGTVDISPDWISQLVLLEKRRNALFSQLEREVNSFILELSKNRKW